MVAPAGYGKTTLLAQWAECKRPRLAWVSADNRDNDLAVLLSYLAVAIDRVERIDPAVFRALASPGQAVSAVPQLASAIASLRRPIALALDHAEAISNPECLDAIAELALSMTAGSQFAIASRSNLELRAARLRAQGGIAEISAEDLAMGRPEASALLAAAGVDLEGGGIEEIMRRTEGWPAGLYLAALAMKAGSPGTDAGFSFTGDDHYMGDYLRYEFLDRVSRAEVTFLTRTSILERMSGPLCDATLGKKGSTRVLEQLESRNLLVIPLDRRRDWYRYHQLFRELLYAELQRREPDVIPKLHSRAAEWYEANAMPEAAIEHGQAAGDANLVARLVLNNMQPVWAGGRVDTALRWIDWLEDKTWVEHYSAIAVHGALIFALLGQPGGAERWAGAAERSADEHSSSAEVLPDGNTLPGTLAYLRALLCRHGVGEMRHDAQIALPGLSPASPYRATMLHTEGVSYLLEGDPDRAEPILAHAVDVAMSAGTLPVVAMVLAERGLAAIEREDWRSAEALAEQALTIVEDGHFDHYWTSALVYAWGARMAAHRGDITRARQYVGRAARLRPLLTYALPVVSAQTLLELARTYIALGDSSGAQTVLRQAQDIFQQRPDLGVLPEQAATMRATLGTITSGASGASSLTTAELRLLPLLPTHLTLSEISQRLFVSRNTVKTQVTAIYRKFGVSTRSEAIGRMHELGLLSQD